MADHYDSEDRLADQNLRSIGAHVPLAPAPTERQRQLWKQTPRLRFTRKLEQPRPPASGGPFMRNRRFFLPAGSAVAAGLIITLLFTAPTRRSIVNAATIVNELRQTTYHGLRVSFSDVSTIGLNGGSVSGFATVIFQQPFNLGQLIDDADAELDPQAVCMNLDVILPEDAGLADMPLHVAGCLSADEKWLYLQSDDPTPLVNAIHPMAALFQQPLQAGMLFELEGVFDENEDPFSTSGAPRHGQVVIGLGASQSDDGAARLHSGVAFDENGDAPAGGSELYVDTDGPTDAELALLKALLAGEATPDDIQAFMAHVEEHLGEASVEEVEPGLHVLTARDVRGLQDHDADLPSGLANAVLRIAYREGVGIEWLELSGIGPHSGAITVNLVDSLDEADSLKREDFIEEGRTVILDVGAMIESLEGFAGQPVLPAFHGER
jgi:hypothetical protein